MPLSSPDAARILRFCLGADDSGSAARHPDGSCVVTIALCRSSHEVHTFEGATFDEALRRAGRAGALKSACVDKQIAFVTRRDPEAAGPGGPGEDAAERPAPGLPLEVPAVGERFLALTDAIGALVHETQRERGMSTLVVGSHGRLFGGDMDEQWRRTDARRQALWSLLRKDAAAPGAVRLRLERADALLADLATLRAGIEDDTVSAPLVIDSYSAINSELLSALDAFMITDGAGASRTCALACMTLLYAKEKTGVERAQLSSAFLQDRFTDGQRLSVAALIASQSTYLHIFSAIAPRPAEQLLRRTLASPAAAEVKRMESVVFGRDEHGFGIDPATWFSSISRKIDMLGDVANATISILRHEGV